MNTKLIARVGVLVSIVAALLATAPTASADRTVVVNTGAGNINVRSGPSTAAQLLRTIPNRTRVVITCHVRGEVFRGGPYGRPTDIWNRLADGGYVTDAMLETGSNDPVVAGCGGAPAAAPASGRAMGQTRGTNTGAAGYCTWGAYAKWYEASGRRFYPALNGNAKDWANSARTARWTVVDDAAPRSIVVFQPGVHGADRTYGHVAWVDSTSRRPDGLYVSVTDMNGAGGFNRWSSRTIKDVPGMSYILLP
ncbi:CHAP domain-containing protein [Mycolicibacterium sp. jd]|uniref:CHAP domain-containing protein n=1 Tax=unclassified Mycolicibacterium TaxID=2636767 RepID=UPI00351BA4FF